MIFLVDGFDNNVGVLFLAIARQVDREFCALSGRGIGEDIPAGLFDDAIDRRQAKPGSRTDLLGGKKRLENLVDHFVRNTGAGILHLEQRVIAVGDAFIFLQPGISGIDVAGADRQRAATVHGVTGVDGKIDDHLLELSLVGLHQPQIAAMIEFKFDICADQPPQQIGRFAQHLGHIENLGLQRLLARKCKELTDQIGGPVGVLLDLLDIGKRLVARRVAQ